MPQGAPRPPALAAFSEAFPTFFFIILFFFGGGLRPRPLHATFVFIDFSPFNLFTPRSSPPGAGGGLVQLSPSHAPGFAYWKFHSPPWGGSRERCILYCIYCHSWASPRDTQAIFFFFYIYVIRLEINYFYADIWVVVPRLLPAWDESAGVGGL